MKESTDYELKFLMFLGRHLPPIPHVTGIINRVLKPVYLRKERKSVVADVFDFKMLLNPRECVDGGILFHPHLFDRTEIKFLQKNLHEGDIFLDVGANIGFYSLIVSRIVGDEGRVLAIEADPFIYHQLVTNIEMNEIKNITAINRGVSDKDEVLSLGICTIGNRGGNSFLREGNEKIEVVCSTLLDIILSADILQVKAIKIDIEGFEYRVLKKFFEQAPAEMHPEILLIEHIPAMNAVAGGDCIQLLTEQGYSVLKTNCINYIMVKNHPERL